MKIYLTLSSSTSAPLLFSALAIALSRTFFRILAAFLFENFRMFSASSTFLPLEVRAIARAFFGEDVRRAWVEPPASAFDAYRTAPRVVHTWALNKIRDRAGNAITPEGEVYTLKPGDDGTSPAKVFRS